jgi:formate transporter
MADDESMSVSFETSSSSDSSSDESSSLSPSSSSSEGEDGERSHESSEKEEETTQKNKNNKAKKTKKTRKAKKAQDSSPTADRSNKKKKQHARERKVAAAVQKAHDHAHHERHYHHLHVRPSGARKEFHQKLFKTPKETVRAVSVAGENKAALPVLKLVIHGLLAGALIAVGALTSLSVGADSKLVFSAVFPVGIFLVVMTGADLFTGDTMFLAVALLNKRARPDRLAYNWFVVYFANFFGSLLVAFFLAWLAGVLDDDSEDAAMRIAEKKVNVGWGSVFLRGIGCNWLVCLALFASIAAEDVVSKMLALWFPIFAFVACSFEHSVANMFFIPLGMLYGADVTVGEFVFKNLIPATLGNIVGGAGFVGAVYFLQYGFPREEHLQESAPKPKWALL